MLGTSKSIWGFVPTSVPGCTLWLDGADNNSMNSASAVTVWNDKSGNSNNVTGSGTWSGSNMVFNGSTNAFSNTGFAFPHTAYSMFAVYSNTTAPTAAAYMNAVYGNGGFPMLGTFGSNKLVSARSVVANTGALTVPVGWAARIAGTTTSQDYGFGIATDPSENVLVIGSYGAAVTVYNQGASGTGAVTLPFVGAFNDCFVAKYNTDGVVVWAARIACRGNGRGIATDTLGNVLVIGEYSAVTTIYNQGAGGAAVVTLPYSGTGNNVFIAKYSPDGNVVWAAQIASTAQDNGTSIATDSSGNVLVTGGHGAPLTLYNQGASGTGAITLPYTSGSPCYIAKYNSAGAVQWAARIVSTGTCFTDTIATDSSGNVLVIGYYQADTTFYNQVVIGTAGPTLPFTGGNDVFVAKYLSDGTVSWAARITGETTGIDYGEGIATDSSGNVVVIGIYQNILTIYNATSLGGGSGATLPYTGGNDVFVAKYSSAGAVLWAARIAGTTTSDDRGRAIATDSSGNILVTGQYQFALTIYNATSLGGGIGATLPVTGGTDCFVAKYSSDGAVLWATRIAVTSGVAALGYGIATDSSRNVFVTGYYGSASTLFNTGGTTGVTLPFVGGNDCFIAKYNPNGYITAVAANSNLIVAATYTPSTMSPFVNGTACTALAGTTLAATGVFVGGPSNYFNGTISEVLIYNNTLTTGERQAVEGYLAYKWGIRSNLPTTQPFYAITPFNRTFSLLDIPALSIWLDGSDNSTMNSTTSVTTWNDKSGNAFNMTGSGTWSGSNMVFNGSTNAFSNTGYVFPISAYSLFAVYSNTTAPAAAAYMNVMYGANGFPMLGTYDVNKFVTARSVVANTGALNAGPSGWAAQATAGAGNSIIFAVTTDTSGNVYVTGRYTAAMTFYSTNRTSSNSIPNTSSTIACFLAKYSPAGDILWAAEITCTVSVFGGYGIATDSSGNVFVGGYYASAMTLYSTARTSSNTLPFGGAGNDVFLAKYSSTGTVLWAARIASSGDDYGYQVATDLNGDVFITGDYSAVLQVYSAGSTTAATTLPYVSPRRTFIVKYSSIGVVVWAAQIIGGAFGVAIATDSSGNVLVTGYYSATTTFYSINNVTNKTLTHTGGGDCFVASYTSSGSISWAAKIASTLLDQGTGIATDSTGNVFAYGSVGGAASVFNEGGTVVGATLAGAGSFLAKYSSTGTVIWAVQITGMTTPTGVATNGSGEILITGYSTAAAIISKYSTSGTLLWTSLVAGSGTRGYKIVADVSGNVIAAGSVVATITLSNSDGTVFTTLSRVGSSTECFIAKYGPNGFFNIPVSAGSNVLVDATYLPSTMSTFVNGNAGPALAGTTLATTGLYLGGPSNYFNGTLSELIIYASTLTSGQRQQVEGYLAAKWGLRASLVSNQPFKVIPPATVLVFSPTVIPGCAIWLDAADNSTMNSTTTVTLWRDKSGFGNNMTGTATWTGSNMTFNGSTQAFSNTAYVFPSNAYSLFAVYSNTTAPAANAYMNVVYGNGGYPMLGVFDANKNVSARSVVANTGALTRSPNPGWAAQIGGTGSDIGNGIATDSSGNVFVTGSYTAAVTIYNQGAAGAGVVTLPFVSGIDCFIAKYSSAGAVQWAARIAGTTGNDVGRGIATDSSGNVFVTGDYSSAVTVYNQGASGTSNVTLPFTGGFDCFVAKYNSIGDVQWAARIAGTTTSTDGGYGIATDSSGDVVVAGYYSAALTVYNQGASGTSNVTLPLPGVTGCFVAKYSSAGAVLWAARMVCSASSGGRGVATDSSGNVLVTGYYNTALTVHNKGAGGVGVVTLPIVTGYEIFIAKYNSIGDVQWAARMVGAGFDIGTGIATDSSGNVLVTAYYGAALTVHNQGASGTGVVTLPFGAAGGSDVFIAKYSSAGAVLWAARMASTTVSADQGLGIASDSSGNVFVTGIYTGVLTVYNQGASGTAGTTLPATGGQDTFIAKYNSIGDVQWAARFGSTGSDVANAIATDPLGNAFVTGYYTSSAMTVYNQGPSGTAATTLPTSVSQNAFIAKYNPDGFISIPTATTNVLVDATYTSSVFSPFINGIAQNTLPGTTLAATGLFVCGPTSYFNGSLSELIVYARTLTTDQRQQVEGYLAKKWRITLPITHPYYAVGPFAT